MTPTNKKKELGKGLRALLSNIENTNNIDTKKEIVRTLNSSVASILIDEVEVNPFQPRVEFENEALMELAKSIKVHGLIQPITVRAMGDSKYQLISGERRWRASRMAGLNEIPAYVRVANDQEMLEMALIENIQRSDLNAVEIAISYQRLMDECNLTHEALSERVGKNRSTVTNYVRLLKLPPEIQNSVKSGELSMGHARSIAGLEDIVRQLQFYKKAINEHLSVRQLEQLVKDNNQVKDRSDAKNLSTPEIQNAEINRIIKDLSKIIGVKINIKRDQKGKGVLQIPFSSDKEFNSIYDLLKELDN
ncbi:MAG: ParB/RepB/Spo0J family partition protein [Saprospiraceae bacterium]|nr:ParB/RepB/Spo0J family partition protein [Saprospiraceae bacterium]MBK8632929.1 ParB/RepB/Spo0J family partition protein [Saprospiraceae bacterium]MBP7642283.1 ParB/RepB/Spo0J family partition protein [Saprospiraceae bacterium]